MTPTTTPTDPESTMAPTVPAPASVQAARRVRLWIAAGSLSLLVALGLVAALVPVPYLTFAPGAATPVAPIIAVGGGFPADHPERSVAFTTVSQRDATLLDALRGWIDDDVQVLPREAVYGSQSREQNRRYNAQLMDTSKLAAAVAAERRLGYTVDVPTSGTVVRNIAAGTPAEGVLELDDVIVAVDGTDIEHLDQLRDLLQVGGPGAEHRLLVERPAGSTTRVELAIRTVPADDDPSRAIIGIIPEERILPFDLSTQLPVPLAIESGRVGGPSAGLAFALAILDVLTPGELTGGHKVAVTGTIDFDGRVGPVGGGTQKAVAVRNAGYEAFLVPSAELEEVQAKVGRDLRVIAVDTLQEALDALASLGGDTAPLDAARPESSP
jgi:PDZ domain-containing protein